MDMKPQPALSNGGRFYLRAGAGYSFHPELTAVYSPELAGRYRMSVYETLHSYFGNYDAFKNDLKNASDDYNGYDLTNRFGAEGRVDFKKSVFTYDVYCNSIAAKDTLLKRGYNTAGIDVRFHSNEDREKYFYYDAGMSFRGGKDRMSYSSSAGDIGITENLFSFAGSFGPVMSRSKRFLVDLNMSFASYGDYLDAATGAVAIVPKYEFSKGKWDLSFGVKLSSFFSRDDTKSGMTPYYSMFNNGSQIIYPDLHVNYTAIKSYMVFYAGVTGGDRMNTYSSLVNGFHRFKSISGIGRNPLLDNTVERANFKIGVKGNFAARFQYDLSAGYNVEDKGLFDKVYAYALPGGGYSYGTAFYYADNDSFSSDFLFLWKSGNLTVNGDLSYDYVRLNDESNLLFIPSPFTGGLEVMYDWNRRIRFGAGCRFASSAKGYFVYESSSSTARIPSYADLDFSMEYLFTRKMSLWIKGSNLLDANIQNHPFSPESGISFTAGICLNL
jgi:hypothetical protein